MVRFFTTIALPPVAGTGRRGRALGDVFLCDLIGVNGFDFLQVFQFSRERAGRIVSVVIRVGVVRREAGSTSEARNIKCQRLSGGNP